LRFQKNRILKWLLLVILFPVVALNIWCGISIYKLSNEHAELKSDYADLNNIKYGLLSVNAWKKPLQSIVAERIEGFTIDKKQAAVLKQEISTLLNSLIDEADSFAHEDKKTIKGKIRKAAINIFIDMDEVRKKVPEFTEAIYKEIKTEENLNKVKSIVREKVNDLAEQSTDPPGFELPFKMLLAKNHASSLEQFNEEAIKKLDATLSGTYKLSLIMLASMLLFLIAWKIVYRKLYLHKLMFALSLLLGLIALGTGLTSPMIEIDARIKEIDFLLLGEHVQFSNQVLFYQSKSILDVVKILISGGKADTVIVGILILAFSIIFPFAKLISTEIFLAGNKKLQSNRLINFFAFKSGKWSMADVTVVAIFMAYIGFKGILNNQMEYLNIKSDVLSTITTNQTALQPGFIVFTSFVIYSLILSELLRRTRQEQTD
jgi:hypothetical protein